MNQLTETKNQLTETREAFENPDWYLRSRGFNIRIRTDIVRSFAQNLECKRVLDIGCGDGSISLPLLTQHNRLTLLDLSSTMLSIARSRVSEKLVDRVDTVNKSFMEVKLEPESYDLILCLGVLAYVEDLPAFCSKLVSLLAPGGLLIVECTDSSHFIYYLTSSYVKLRGLVMRPRVPLCLRSAAVVENMFWKLGLRRQASYKYALPLPVIRKCFSQAFQYRTTRSLFGSPLSNRNSWLGNECIYSFRKGSL